MYYSHYSPNKDDMELLEKLIIFSFGDVSNMK